MIETSAYNRVKTLTEIYALWSGQNKCPQWLKILPYIKKKVKELNPTMNIIEFRYVNISTFYIYVSIWTCQHITMLTYEQVHNGRPEPLGYIYEVKLISIPPKLKPDYDYWHWTSSTLFIQQIFFRTLLYLTQWVCVHTTHKNLPKSVSICWQIKHHGMWKSLLETNTSVCFEYCNFDSGFFLCVLNWSLQQWS